MQPQQRGQATDGRNLRAQVAADHVGVDHGIPDHAGGTGGIDRQRTHQHGGHVVHHRRQQGREHSRADGCAPDAALGKAVQNGCDRGDQPGIAQSVDHQIHAQREHDDLPRRAMQYLAGADDAAACRHGQQQGGTCGRDRADWHAQRLQPEEADQQQDQDHPARAKGRRIADRIGRAPELGQVIGCGNAAPKEQHQHGEAGQHRGEIDRHHYRGVFVEADVEKVGRDDVDQVGDDQRQAGRVGDEACRHDECQRGGGRKAQRHEHGHHDGRENQGGAVIGEQGGHSRTQQHDEREQLAAPAAAPACEVQRGPFEEAGLVKQQADDDDGYKGGGRIPHDAPDHWNVGKMHHAGQQGNDRAQRGAPANAQAARLPDNQHKGGDEDQDCHEHGAGRSGFRRRAFVDEGGRQWEASSRAVPCSLAFSSLSSGRLTSSSRRRRIMCRVCRNASSLTSSDASPCEGSAYPQWAVAGWPGQIGQTSPAALSHAVMI
ncbi:hypothetical protein COLO4_01089, partial [Corchorus olitorius]